jgi:predicted RNA-binding protein with PUA domain
MAYNLIKSYTATATTSPKTVFANDGKVLGVVDDVDNVEAYDVGDEVPVVVDGIVKLSATTYAYDSATSSWVKSPAKEGDVLFYDSANKLVKIDDGDANQNQIIGKVLKVIIPQSTDSDGIYEIKV